MYAQKLLSLFSCAMASSVPVPWDQLRITVDQGNQCSRAAHLASDAWDDAIQMAPGAPLPQSGRNYDRCDHVSCLRLQTHVPAAEANVPPLLLRLADACEAHQDGLDTIFQSLTLEQASSPAAEIQEREKAADRKGVVEPCGFCGDGSTVPLERIVFSEGRYMLWGICIRPN
jgi:hypothetical protein